MCLPKSYYSAGSTLRSVHNIDHHQSSWIITIIISCLYQLGKKGKRPVRNLSTDLTHGESLLVVTSYSGPGPCFGYMSTENEPFATTARYIVNKSKTFLPWQFISQEAIIAGHEGDYRDDRDDVDDGDGLID